MKLSWVHNKSYTGWTKWIGRSANGKPHCFYLGKDRTEADSKAMKLTLAYRQLKAAGGMGWTEEAIEAALATPTAPTLAPPPPPPAAPMLPPAIVLPQPVSRVIANGLMLHAAIDEYLDHEMQRAPNQVSYAYIHGVRLRVKRLKEAMPDRPLAEVAYDDLAQLVAHFASRPISKHNGRKISVVTASDAIKGARAMFDWFDLSGRWDAPKRFERIFRVKRKSMMTSEERDQEWRGVALVTDDGGPLLINDPMANDGKGRRWCKIETELLALKKRLGIEGVTFSCFRDTSSTRIESIDRSLTDLFDGHKDSRMARFYVDGDKIDYDRMFAGLDKATDELEAYYGLTYP